MTVIEVCTFLGGRFTRIHRLVARHHKTSLHMTGTSAFANHQATDLLPPPPPSSLHLNSFIFSLGKIVIYVICIIFHKVPSPVPRSMFKLFIFPLKVLSSSTWLFVIFFSFAFPLAEKSSFLSSLKFSLWLVK
jgi:hypothetical protein